jgi:ABC-2 type transport system permease protein
MGVMNASIIGMAVAISRFREQKILRRILATPLAPIRFLSSQIGARLVLSIIQSALILAVGIFLFGAELHGQLIWLFVLVTFANLIFLNLGFAAAGRAKNPDAAQGIANAIALPMMFLSGTFFPTDTLPVVVQWIVKFLPLTPLLEAMRRLRRGVRSPRWDRRSSRSRLGRGVLRPGQPDVQVRGGLAEAPR